MAESFGILLFCNSFTGDNIKIITENLEFSQFLPKLFKKAFGFGFVSQPEDETTGKQIFQITDPEKLSAIMASYGFDRQETLALHVNLPVVEEDCCRCSFLRGAFLAGGSVTDPEKGYHLELTTTHQSVSRETGAGAFCKSSRRICASAGDRRHRFSPKEAQLSDVRANRHTVHFPLGEDSPLTLSASRICCSRSVKSENRKGLGK